MFQLFAGPALMMTDAELSENNDHFLHSTDMSNCGIIYTRDGQQLLSKSIIAFVYNDLIILSVGL